MSARADSSGEPNLSEKIYGNLGGVVVEARRVNIGGANVRIIPIGALVGVVVGLFFSTLIFYDTSGGPVTLGRFLATASWYVLVGVIVVTSISAIFALYSPYPRRLNGRITLDRVENGKLWFYTKSGRRDGISLPKQKVNVHDDLTIHFGIVPRILELRMQTADETRLLITALKGQVKSLRTYEDDGREEGEDPLNENKN